MSLRPDRAARGAAARLSGRRAEVLAACWLMLKGYRILGFRLRTPQAEIDLLALRDRYGLGIAIGNVGVTLLSLAEAYCAFARGGLHRPPLCDGRDGAGHSAGTDLPYAALGPSA